MNLTENKIKWGDLKLRLMQLIELYGKKIFAKETVKVSSVLQDVNMYDNLRISITYNGINTWYLQAGMCYIYLHVIQLVTFTDFNMWYILFILLQFYWLIIKRSPWWPRSSTTFCLIFLQRFLIFKHMIFNFNM